MALLPPTAMATAAKVARKKNSNSDDDDDDDFAGGGFGGGGGGGFDPATAWFDAASIVPLVSGTPALDEAAAAAVAGAAPSAATTKTTTTAAPAAAAAPSSSSSRRRTPTKAERARARHKQRAALLRAALAGGIASGATTLALFPLDTLKTRLQASSGRSVAAAAATATATATAMATAAAASSTSATTPTTLASVVREGLLDKRALYRGVVPASLGSFFSHGLRTFSYEAALMALTAAGFAGAGSGAAAAAASSQLRLQALASATGTAIGTCVRIPTEVLKQRLQVGLHANALDAARAARDAGGLPWSLFAGTGATLAREVPFYAAGMAAYEVLKNMADGSATSPTRTPSRELARWEMIALGASGVFLFELFGVERKLFETEKNSLPHFFSLSLSSSSTTLGGCAGAIASLFTTPADVIKTRVMTAPPSAPVSAVAGNLFIHFFFFFVSLLHSLVFSHLPLPH